jgi:hypothetical protein
VNVSQRLTATIDHVNAVLDQAHLLPCRIESIGLYADGRLAEVAVRYEDGHLYATTMAASYLNPITLMEVVHRSFLLQWCDIDLADAHDPDFDVIGFATGKAPPSPPTHRDQTHPGPEVAQ